MVAIDHAKTILLFVFEMAIWLITCPHRRRQLMMYKNY